MPFAAPYIVKLSLKESNIKFFRNGHHMTMNQSEMKLKVIEPVLNKGLKNDADDDNEDPTH